MRKPKEGEKPGNIFGWFFAAFNWVFDKASSAYGVITKQIIRFAYLAILSFIGLLILTVWVFLKSPTSFIPPQDKGYLISLVFLPDGASLDRTEAVVKKVGDIALHHPAVAGAVGSPGLSINGFTSIPNAAVVFLPLKDYSQRQSPDLYAEAVKDS